eukprot:4308012-Prymnesium_polylepis.3
MKGRPQVGVCASLASGASLALRETQAGIRARGVTAAVVDVIHWRVKLADCLWQRNPTDVAARL